MLSSLIQDLRLSLRALRRAPGFTAVMIATLALGVGANSAVFSLVNAVLLRPLPYAEPDRLVLVWESAPFFGLTDSPVSPANYVDWRQRARSFEEMGAMEDTSYRLTGDGAPEVVEGSCVTASFWRALRARPALGRTFRDDEDQPGAAPVVILSDAFWQRRYQRDPAVLGRTLRLNDKPHVIIGVLAPGVEPPGQYHTKPGELWTPFGSGYDAAGWAARGRHNWMVAARLAPGVTLKQADAEMRSIGAALARQYPQTNEKVGAFVAPLREHFVGDARKTLFLLLGTVAFILLIACANLVNLLLTRSAARAKEVAVRAALGAQWPALLRRAACESLLLCAAGSALGLLIATAAFRYLARFAPTEIGAFQHLGIDLRVAAFTSALAVAVAFVFSLVPLWQLRRLDVTHALKQSARGAAGAAGARRLRALLVGAEVGLAFVLLIGAGLLLRTLAAVRGTDPGFRPDHLLTLSMPQGRAQRPIEETRALQHELLRQLNALPGVESAGLTNHIPITFKGDITSLGIEGRDPKDRAQARIRTATPGYFHTMGIPLRAGRDFAETDDAKAPMVIVVNEALARQLWPGQSAVGRRVSFDGDAWVPVVGVVGNIRQAGLDVESKPEFYISAWQRGFPATALALRTRVDPATLTPAVRRLVWSVLPDQPVADVTTMDEILDENTAQRRLISTLLGAFAALALGLASLGLYGLLAYLVGQQTQEIGLRMALGAAPGDMLRHVVGHALRLTLGGLVVGVAGALALSRLIENFLHGVKPTDPATYALVAAALLCTSALAAYLPARRAMRVDPMVALREE
jgi:putative ABC transport system permease protein